jgi:class 3 adenylate cyclase
VRRKNEELKALSNKLAKYLSRQVYNSIFEGKKDVKIESYRKKLTVFFSDIEGFTELSDRLGMSKPLRVRMGINTGFCTVGNFGSEERLDYTIIGNQ